ncbi:MAG TPA: cytochrome b/b6 domain-containing protein [Burkholderiaceae bacterium]|nr:cytochrome b/b6 domain-containing protein [Burkholderiaceae bacterium]
MAIALHWLMAVAIVAEIALGWWMLDIPKLPAGVRAGWFNLHKSVGLTLGVLLILRLLWRLKHSAPPLPASVPQWQIRAAHINHALMYLCLVTLVLAGYLGSSFSGYPIRWFGVLVPGWGWRDDTIKEAMSVLHYWASWLLMTLLVLHLTATLKHALFDRDGTLARMLPARRGTRHAIARGQGA